MKLDIIYRTHDGGSIQRGEPVKRKVEGSKQEIVLRCAYSLSKSIELCKEDINITIIDDHSSKKTIRKLEILLGDVTPLEGTGNLASMQQFFKSAKDSDADLVYLVEDDFLHKPETVSELIETYYKFLDNVEPDMICLYPDDDYYNYTHHFGPTMIVPGVNRPWRMHDRTSCTFFTNPEVIRIYWNIFEKHSTHYGIGGISGDHTYNTIWKNHIPLFTPLVPLAFHLDDHDPLFYKNAIAELWEENKL